MNMCKRIVFLVAVLSLFTLCLCEASMAEDIVSCENCGSTNGHYEDYRIQHRFVCDDCSHENEMMPHTLDCECHMYVAGDDGPYCYGCGKKNPGATNIVATPTATPTAAPTSTPVQSALTAVPEESVTTPAPTDPELPTQTPDPGTPTPEPTVEVTVVAEETTVENSPLPEATPPAEEAVGISMLGYVVLCIVLVVGVVLGAIWVQQHKRRKARQARYQMSNGGWDSISTGNPMDFNGTSGTAANSSQRRKKPNKSQKNRTNGDDFYGF